MKIKYILEQAVKKNKIRCIDLNFALYISKKQHYLVTLTAAFTSYAIGNGHICLPINILYKYIIDLKKTITKYHEIFQFLDSYQIWDQILLKSKIIGNDTVVRPLIFSNNCVYLYKTWKAENLVLNFIFSQNPKFIYDIKQCKLVINSLFDSTNFINFQKIAVSMAIIQKITFIIGGPGTGKTTVIAKILITMIKIHKQPIKIKLAAPTGKAAAHLTQSLNKNISLQKILNENNKKKIYKAVTIHKLIGIIPDSSLTYYNKTNVLDLDLLIIDESSMIDLFIMEKLINALPKHTKVIFFGDINQLPSIGNGNLLKDICYIANNTFNNIIPILNKITNYNIVSNVNSHFFNNHICILNKNYRFENNSGIHQLSTALMKEDPLIFYKIKNKHFKNIKLYTIHSKYQYIRMLQNIIQQYKDYWKAILQNKPIQNCIKIFYNCRILVAIKNGIFGMEEINKNIEKLMKQKRLINYVIRNGYKGYIGKPIIISKNSKTLGLLNGDIGIMKLDKNNNLVTYFQIANEKIVIIPANILPEHNTAWTMTIHKAQGSEFIHSILILPNIMSTILTKELIYTAITRSRKTLVIYASQKIFLQSMIKKTNRYSQIRQKILINSSKSIV
ncbi:RecBCD enzyme subunit RecD [Buchnera aphidicola (Eriosoma lanigerum)]|uniref:exodeoxyribonuclease V subunit alpha n=1 Tax=Buchnera aphidicola TaxID=9 RepID=UPI0034639F6D